MTNPSVPQRERSQFNPLNLGRFDRTSLRLLTGTLGPKSQIIQGGYGNDTYNNWFKLTLLDDACIIAIKAGTKLATSNYVPTNRFSDTSTRFEIAFYDMNKNPIESRVIHQEPRAYKGDVAGGQSDLYNTYDSKAYNKGDELFYDLVPGEYMFCVSATRNELFQYGVGLVVEFSEIEENFIMTEDFLVAYMLQEDFGNSSAGFLEIPQVVTQTVTLNELSAYTPVFSEIASGIFVQVNFENTVTKNPLTWVIGPDLEAPNEGSKINLDATENWYNTIPPNHSLSEWKAAWDRDHSYDERFPSGVFAPFATSQ